MIGLVQWADVGIWVDEPRNPVLNNGLSFCYEQGSNVGVEIGSHLLRSNASINECDHSLGQKKRNYSMVIENGVVLIRRNNQFRF
jgi:hypothetical protein